MSNIIPLSGLATVEFVPSPFRGDSKIKPTFLIRIPTFQMRDKMASLLFERGFIPATLSQGRGILIDALYDLYDEGTADEHASFLESYWTKSEIHDEMLLAWQMQEGQRLFDISVGVDPGKATGMPIPPAPFTMREQARQARIVTEVLERHDRYRAYQARFMSTQAEEDEMLVRLFIGGWTGVGDVKPQWDDMQRLTDNCIEAARGWLEQADGSAAWAEVVNEVKAKFGAPAVLEKNSASPLDTNSNPTGSRISSGDLATSDGSSTVLSTDRTPGSASPETSGALPNLPSKPTAKKTRRGRTAKP